MSFKLKYVVILKIYDLYFRILNNFMNLNYLLYVFVVNSFSKFNFFLFNFNILFSWILSIDKVTVEFFRGDQ